MPAKNTIVALDVAEASVSTATITIRAIHVGKKQMTQSVFRQLPVAPLVDEVNILLLGIPWGWVNYRWGEIPDTHTNFIFQVGSRLFRKAVLVRASASFTSPKYCPSPFGRFKLQFQGLACALHCARILEGWRPDRRRRDQYGQWIWSDYFDSEPIVECGDAEVPDCFRFIDPDEDLPERAIKALQDKIREVTGDIKTSSQICARIATLECHASDYRVRWDLLMEQLRGVEQLFIAC